MFTGMLHYTLCNIITDGVFMRYIQSPLNCRYFPNLQSLPLIRTLIKAPAPANRDILPCSPISLMTPLASYCCCYCYVTSTSKRVLHFGQLNARTHINYILQQPQHSSHRWWYTTSCKLYLDHQRSQHLLDPVLSPQKAIIFVWLPLLSVWWICEAGWAWPLHLEKEGWRKVHSRVDRRHCK